MNWNPGRVSRQEPASLSSAPGRACGIIIFDGTCAFCSGAAAFVARRDPARYFRFADAESSEGAALLAAHRINRATTQSLVLIEGGQAYLRSTASLRIASRLSWPWPTTSVLLLVPVPLRDLAYLAVARVRHHIAGPRQVCVPLHHSVRERMVGSTKRPKT